MKMKVKFAGKLGLGLALAALASACATTGGRSHWASNGHSAGRSPASNPTVLRKLLAEASEEGMDWLVKLLGKEADQGAAARIRSGLATLRPSEIREDEQLLKILQKDISELVEADAKYLLDVATTRAVSLANCPECVRRRELFFETRKVIRERLVGAAGKDREARAKIVGFVKQMEVLIDKGMIEPARAKDFLLAVQTERFRGPQVGSLVDTVQMMLISVGNDFDPKAAADIINNWPDSSLQGLRRFYTELTLVQASDGLGMDEAAEVVLKRFNVTDDEEIRAMKICSLLKK